MDVISYLKEYIRITLAVIKTPQAFFEGMKGEEKGYLKPFVYLLVSYAVTTIGGYLGFFLLYASSSSNLYSSTYPFLVVASYVAMQYVFTIFYIEATQKKVENIPQQVY